MNINEIRAEIPKAFSHERDHAYDWLIEFSEQEDLDPDTPRWEDNQAAARKLVDWAYEAGKAENFKNCFEDAAEQRKSGYLEGFDAASKDPKAWYVLDKNGEQIKLEDKVKTSEGILTVTRICGDVEPMECFILASDDNGGWQFKPWKVEKVIPDNREKIKEEIADLLTNSYDSKLWTEDLDEYKLADKIISRIEALEKQ